eukprot:TRINITY_DN84912_c0_g1_i1.p1 TRINITY_DN84912_c0_g1~~TRINITY_DN84912_c0_g1_i1.p1  ORF type:complete len:127 (+),score=23.00 TRINITY_DN84912_c0_g1_i1:88-468(+)
MEKGRCALLLFVHQLVFAAGIVVRRADTGSCAPIYQECQMIERSYCAGYGSGQYCVDNSPKCSFLQMKNATGSEVSSEKTGSCRSLLGKCRTCFTEDAYDYPDPENVCNDICRACVNVQQQCDAPW